MMPQSHPKESQFAATTFWVHAPSGRIPIRVDRPSHANGDGALDQLLEQYGAREYAFITAYNPNGKRHGAALNASAQERLRDRLEQSGLTFLPGIGEPDPAEGGTAKWPGEPSFFVLGVSEEAARGLGGDFGQAMIVYGSLGEPAKLALSVPQPSGDPSHEEDR